MAEGYRVAVEEVRAHANTVSGFHDRTGTAADAGAHVSSLDDAYGILCQPFGSMVHEPQTRGTEALRKTETATAHLAEDLNSAAEAYERMEDKVTEILRELASSLDDIRPEQGGAPGVDV